MSPAARSFLAAMVVLTVLGLLLGGDDRELGATSFGRLPSGHGAVYDLLAAAGLPVGRSYVPADRLPSDATVWWVAPWGLCAPEPSDEAPPLRLGAEGLDRFAAAGGRAVVLLGGESCPELVGHALPPRTEAREPGEGAPSAVTAPAGAAAEGASVVDGPLVSAPRRLEGGSPRAFEATGDWRVVATLDGRPFGLERTHGRGRIAVLADAFFVRNAHLDAGDAAPLVIDLVARYGVPVFDERQHGLRLETGAIPYLAGSPARYLFAGLTALGLAVAWWGRARVPRTPPLPETPAPTLAGFVTALARLYRRSRDRNRVAERYRDVCRAQLRRHFALPPHTPWEVVEARLERARPEIDREILRSAPGGRGEAALRAWAGELDRIVEDTCR